MTLVQVTLDGLELDWLDDDTGLARVVTSVEGWYGTPEPDTGDAQRVLTDGAIYGPKTIRGREITIEGTVVGPRAALMDTRDALAARAVNRSPVDLVVGDPWLGGSLTAEVRGASPMEHTFIRETAFRYQLTLLAADPRKYEVGWQQATIVLSGGTAGRTYPRRYTWSYGAGDVPGQARLMNRGNVPAPVLAVYDGPLSETRLTDGTTTIRIAPLLNGEQLWVSTDTLLAQASGGVSRASYVLAGSAPLLIPPGGQSTLWRLLGTGLGKVTLSWRSAWT